MHFLERGKEESFHDHYLRKGGGKKKKQKMGRPTCRPTPNPEKEKKKKRCLQHFV